MEQELSTKKPITFKPFCVENAHELGAANEKRCKNYRFDFTDEIQSHLQNFAKIHRYDDRHAFKDAWTNWIKTPEIAELIGQEIDILETNGFKGDALDKMFKSVRYYYRKKLNKSEQMTTLEPEPDQIYAGFSSTFLKMIDDEILQQINSHITIDDQDPSDKTIQLSLQQAKAYQVFCQNYKTQIYTEFVAMRNKYGTIPDNISAKMKKTYKNRFYNLRQKWTNNQIN